MVRTGEDGPKGISCLVIEKDMTGVSFGAQEKKLGWHSQPTAQVNFDEVRVPAENLRRRRGRGLPHRDDGPRRRPPQHRRLLARRRPALPRRGGQLHQGAQAVRPADRRFPEHPVHARRHGDRAAGGAACCSTPRRSRSPRTRPTRPSSRPWPSASPPTPARSVVDRALQLHGGYGYLQDYPIERFWRDLRVHSILEGTNQVMRMIVGRELTRQ